jgi:hypothetical protein
MWYRVMWTIYSQLETSRQIHIEVRRRREERDVERGREAKSGCREGKLTFISRRTGLIFTSAAELKERLKATGALQGLQPPTTLSRPVSRASQVSAFVSLSRLHPPARLSSLKKKVQRAHIDIVHDPIEQHPKR